MTLPHEEARAIASARDFMRALLDAKRTPKIPREVRRWAAGVLKHYPIQSVVEERWKWKGEGL